MTERSLTPGEVSLAKQLYRESIDYSSVKIHKAKFVFFQPNDSGMTPNGEIYMSGNAYYPDYSVLPTSGKAFFLHEMAHVWQYQLNVLNPVLAAIGESFSHAFDYDKAYEYTLDASKDLLDYDIEQQASILEDYYRVVVARTRPTVGAMQNELSDVISGRLFQPVLKQFLKAPSYARRMVACEVKRRGGRRVSRCAKVRVR